MVGGVGIDRPALTCGGVTDNMTHIASDSDSQERHDMNQLTVRGFDDELNRHYAPPGKARGNLPESSGVEAIEEGRRPDGQQHGESQTR